MNAVKDHVLYVIKYFSAFFYFRTLHHNFSTMLHVIVQCVEMYDTLIFKLLKKHLDMQF